MPSILSIPRPYRLFSSSEATILLGFPVFRTLILGGSLCCNSLFIMLARIHPSSCIPPRSASCMRIDHTPRNHRNLPATIIMDLRIAATSTHPSSASAPASASASQGRAAYVRDRYLSHARTLTCYAPPTLNRASEASALGLWCAALCGAYVMFSAVVTTLDRMAPWLLSSFPILSVVHGRRCSSVLLRKCSPL